MGNINTNQPDDNLLPERNCMICSRFVSSNNQGCIYDEKEIICEGCSKLCLRNHKWDTYYCYLCEDYICIEEEYSKKLNENRILNHYSDSYTFTKFPIVFIFNFHCSLINWHLIYQVFHSWLV